MNEPIEPASDPRADRVRSAVSAWTRQLVDLGGPNTLLWYRDLPTGTFDLTTAHPGGVAMLMTGRSTRLSSLLREPAALAEGRRRVRAIAHTARELREERGLEAAFAAFGMASWQLPGPAGHSRMPCAPVLLRALSLRPTGPDEADYTLDLGDGIELNPVLEHYLTVEAGLSLDGGSIEALASGPSGFDPYPAYAALEKAGAGLPGFRVAPRVVVGTFAYTKLGMVADLAAHGDGLARHDVVAALAGDPGVQARLRASRGEATQGAAPRGAVTRGSPARAGEPALVVSDPVAADALTADARAADALAADPRAGDPVAADPLAPAAPRWSTSVRGRSREAPLVLDADSSQVAAIDAVRGGGHVVIEGAPGTGMTQTLANLVAVLTAEGKRVLLVAEKRAALDAVLDRLAAVDLGDLVLDLGDGARGRRRVASELVAALDAAVEDRPEQRHLRDRRRRAQEILDGHVAATHVVREPFGVSVHEVMERVSALARTEHPPRTRVRFAGDVLAGLDRATHERHTDELVRLASLGAWATTGPADPWFGARIATEDDVRAARERLDRVAHGGVERVHAEVAAALAGLAVESAATVRQLGGTLATLSAVRDTLEVFRPEIFDEPLDAALLATGPGGGANRPGWWERRRIKSGVRHMLRPGPPPADLHRALSAAAEQRDAWHALAGAGGRPEIPVELDHAHAAYRSLAADLVWLDERMPRVGGAPGLLDLERPALIQLLDALAERTDRLEVLPTVREPLDALAAAGLGELVEDLARRAVPERDVRAECDFAWWTSVENEIAAKDERIGTHSGDRLREAAQEYAATDREIVAEGSRLVRHAVQTRRADAVHAHPDQAEALRAEAGGTGRPTPPRALVEAAEDVVLAARPCWAMSPLVVASVLPPVRCFDVVILAEASQIRPAEAISAISRAGQVVLAGDPRQLPPTVLAASDEPHRPDPEDPSPGPLADSESVLDVLGDLLPVRRLTWHYRSLDERLFAFSNEHCYGGSLVTFPGTAPGSALVLDRVAGVGVPPDEGGVESTGEEVDRVVELVLEHARTRPQESLGVVALGRTHAERVDEALRRAIAALDPEAAAFFDETAPERFFVKDVDHVQGDVRDAVVLTLGYGKTPHGRVFHRFGPLSADGGDRRLNVAITRARRRMTLLTSLGSEDLDPERIKGVGARLLRELLAHVEAEQPGPRGSARDGDGVAPDGGGLIAEFAERLRAERLVVHAAYGCSAGAVELAIESPDRPGRLVVAVETDGPRYAAQHPGRDRDRLRGDQLRRLGWRPLRIFLRDIYRDPAREVHRVSAFVDGRDRGAGA